MKRPVLTDRALIDAWTYDGEGEGTLRPYVDGGRKSDAEWLEANGPGNR